MLKVALINPPVMNNKNWVREGRCQQIDIWGAPFPPFTLAMISTGLEKKQIENMIIDAGPENLQSDQVIERLKSFNPDWIVMTTATPTIESDLGWFASLLKSNLAAKIIAVGIHVSTLPKESLKSYPAVDVVICGEPELTVLDIVSGTDFSEIKGIAYRKTTDIVEQTAKREFTDDLDILGFPNWKKINFKNYIMPIKGKPFSMLHFARGCPHRCSYCTAHTYNGRGFRRRTVGSLIEEIQFNMSLGVHDFLFWTELMTGDHKYLNAFLDALIETGISQKIRWVCNSRVDTVTQELLNKMKQAGCWQIAFGFDFGTDRLLKHTLKGGRATVELGKQAAAMAAKAGLVVDGHFMLGYPGESEQEVSQTIKMALDMPLTFSHFYAVVPYPGSQLYLDWLETRKKNITDQAERVDWSQFDQRTALVATEELSQDKIMKYKSRAYKKFYMRPKMIYRILKLPRSAKEFYNLGYSSLHTLKNLAFGSE